MGYINDPTATNGWPCFALYSTQECALVDQRIDSDWCHCATLGDGFWRIITAETRYWLEEAIRESDRICMSQKKFFIAQLKQWKQHAAGTQWTSSMPHAPWRVRRYSWKRSRLGIMETDGAWWRLSSLSYINSDQYWSIFINVYQCLSMLFNIYQCLSKLTMFIIIINVYQYLSMFINIYQCLSMFINVYQCSSIFINVYQN